MQTYKKGNQTMAKRQPLHQELLENPRLNQTINLRDGRTLGYAEYGAAEGQPILYFHGGNGSRFEGQWFTDAATKNNIRLIAPDRPGFGLSDFQPDRQMRDWANDVEALADQLGIDKFAIFGLSGGGPFVASLAYFIPKRLSRAAIISGTAPPNATERFKGMWFPVRMIFFLAHRLPALNRFALQQMGKFYADPDQMRRTMLKGLPKPDIEFLERVPMAVDIFSADASESHRQEVDGDAYEWQLYVNDWGFRNEDISMEIALWYGRYDVQVTPAMGEYFAKTLSHNVFHLVEDGGHFSTINNHIEAILDYLMI
jgi:pimeloyl-ACP methyl ester carboxylesterase